MRKLSLLVTLCFAGVAPGQTAPREKPRLVVTAITAGGGVTEAVANAMTDAVSSEVAKAGYFSVLSSNDIRTLIGMERQRELVGCKDESSSCLSELAGALGARFVMAGTLTQLGDAYQLTLQALDSTKAQPLGRATRIANDLKTLQGMIPFAVADATATPQPAPPSRLLPYSLIAAGSVAVLGGAIFGLQAITQDGVLQRELENGANNPAGLRTRESYAQEAAVTGQQRTIALVALISGAALIGSGIAVNPRDGSARGSTDVVSFMVGPAGASIAGVF